MTTESQSILGVELFRTGHWNDDDYTVKDLDDMVSAFGQVGFRPPLKVGHTTAPGAPAAGWVANLRRVGEKLIADFVDIPKQVFEAIRQRSYGPVSTEIWWDFERGKETFRRVLKAVALLGADIPAVADLKPAFENLSAAKWAAEKSYTLATEFPKSRDKPLKRLVFTREAMKRICVPCAAKMAKDGVTQAVFVADGNDYVSIPAELAETLLREKPMADVKKHRVEERDGEFCIIGEDGASVACYPTKDEAEAALREKAAAQTEEDGQMKEQVAALQTQLKESEAKRTESDKKIAKLEEDGRQKRITDETAKIAVPALRPHFKALYDLATRDGAKVVKFSTDGKDEKDSEPVAVLNALRDSINKQAEKLFGEHAIVDTSRDEGKAEDPGVELDKRIRKHMAEKGEKDYKAARDAVFAADPELKKQYAGV